MHPPRRLPIALVALVATLLVVSALPVAADSRTHKAMPNRVIPYRVGHAFTADTDLLSASGYAAWMIDEVLGSTTPLPAVGAAFMDAERDEGINARYLVAHAVLETRWGTSAIARSKHNLFGYNALDRGPWRYAARFASYPAGIAAVAQTIRQAYLTPGGRYWHGYPTLRAMNLSYASDPSWADKIASLATRIDGLVVTLKERGLRFGATTLARPATAAARLAVDIPWRANPGAALPAGITFALRWTPVELVGAATTGLTRAPATGWTLVKRTDRPDSTVRLAATAPAEPGLWRLEVQARDSDGSTLPKADSPSIRPLIVQVAAARDAGIDVTVSADGNLAAVLTSRGRQPIESSGPSGTDGSPGSASAVEAWALPLDPSAAAVRLASAPVQAPLAPGEQVRVVFPAPSVAAVVVVRLVGDPAAIGRSDPVAVLVTPSPEGPPTVTLLAIASPRDDVLLGRKPAADGVAIEPLRGAGLVRVMLDSPVAVPELDPVRVAVEGRPADSQLLVRSVAAEPNRAATPSAALRSLAAATPIAGTDRRTLLDVSGLPAGIRLVMAAVVPTDGVLMDGSTIRLAWIPVAAADVGGVTPH